MWLEVKTRENVKQYYCWYKLVVLLSIKNPSSPQINRYTKADSLRFMHDCYLNPYRNILKTTYFKCYLLTLYKRAMIASLGLLTPCMHGEILFIQCYVLHFCLTHPTRLRPKTRYFNQGILFCLRVLLTCAHISKRFF